MVDCRGTQLLVGDTVAYTEGWATKVFTAEIKEFTKKMVILKNDAHIDTFKKSPRTLLRVKL